MRGKVDRQRAAGFGLGGTGGDRFRPRWRTLPAGMRDRLRQWRIMLGMPPATSLLAAYGECRVRQAGQLAELR